MSKKVSKSIKLAIAVPTYNEAKNISKLTKQLKNALEKTGVECTLFIIDDNSPDGTGTIADGLAKKEKSKNFQVRVMHRKGKEGLGRAYIAGFKELLKDSYTHILQMDADLSHNPKYIPQFIEAAKNGADFVVGSRYIKGGDTPDWAWHRKLISRLGNIYTRFFLGSKIHDYTGGFNLYSRELLGELQLDTLQAGGYGFLIELKYRALRQANKLAEVPIVFMDRTLGVSKIPKSTLVKNLLLVPRIRSPKLQANNTQDERTGILLEALSILAVISGFFIELRFIVTSAWENFLFNNSDMLTLPLVQQSIALKEPFHWIFSSQIFLFPEAVLYTLSATISPNFRVALVVNALLSCLIFYVLMRLITRYFQVSATLSRLFAALSALFVLFLARLEVAQALSVATMFLVTTSYYGVILSALLSIALIIRLLRTTADKWRGRSLEVTSAILFAVALLTALSNPLYAFQFVAPLALVCGLGWLINILSFKRLCWIVGPQVIATELAMTLRKHFFSQYFSKQGDVSNYLHYSNAYFTAETFKDMLREMVYGVWEQKLEVTLIFGAIFLAIALFLISIYIYTRKVKLTENKNASATFILLGIAGIAPAALISGLIITGDPVLRYMLPIIFYPLLAIIPLLKAFDKHQRSQSISLTLLLACTLFVFVTALFSHPISTVTTVSDYYTQDQQCLDNTLGGTSYTVGIAQYWRARGLQLGSRRGIKVLQVEGVPARFDWLYNSSDYQIYKPDFVIVDKLPAPHFDPNVSYNPAFTISAYNAKIVIGEPTHIYSCPSFYIYTYAVNNPGRAILDKRLMNPSLGMW